MNQPAVLKATGWIALGALIALAPQLSGCDTTPQHDSLGEVEQKSTGRAQIVAPPSEPSRSEEEASPQTTETEKAEKKEAREKKTEKPQEHATTESPSVKRLVIASDVEEREPVEISEGKVSQPIVAFVELKNEGAQESGVVVTFEHEEGKKVGFVQLNVPPESPRFRTWARTRNIDKPGTWTAIVSSEEGQELARKTFVVTG